jgi:hypothetical protein
MQIRSIDDSPQCELDILFEFRRFDPQGENREVILCFADSRHTDEYSMYNSWAAESPPISYETEYVSNPEKGTGLSRTPSQHGGWGATPPLRWIDDDQRHHNLNALTVQEQSRTNMVRFLPGQSVIVFPTERRRYSTICRI